jgi:hypothetical protein
MRAGIVLAMILTAGPAGATTVKEIIYASCGKNGGIATQLEKLRSGYCIKGWKRTTEDGHKVSGACYGPFNQDYEGENDQAPCVTFKKKVKDKDKTPKYETREEFKAEFEIGGFTAKVSFFVHGHCNMTKAETCTPTVARSDKYAGRKVNIESYSSAYAQVDAEMDSAGSLNVEYKGSVLPVEAELAGSFKCTTVLEAHKFAYMQSFKHTCEKSAQQ